NTNIPSAAAAASPSSNPAKSAGSQALSSETLGALIAAQTDALHDVADAAKTIAEAAKTIVAELARHHGHKPPVTLPVATPPAVTPPAVTPPVVTAPVVTAPVVTAPVVTPP